MKFFTYLVVLNLCSVHDTPRKIPRSWWHYTSRSKKPVQRPHGVQRLELWTLGRWEDITDLLLVGEKSASKGTKGVEVIEAGDEGTSTLNSEDKKDKSKEKEKVLEHLADAEKVSIFLFCLKRLSHESCRDTICSRLQIAKRLPKCLAKT